MPEYHLRNNLGKILTLKIGDITTQEVDAIVNAANPTLLGGGGVDGAIHRAGGIKIIEECRKIINDIGKLNPGGVVITSGGNLAAKYVIHAVGPIWRGGNSSEAKILENAYFQSLNKADEFHFKVISFPSISTGAYGYPVEKAAKIALQVTLNYMESQNCGIENVRFILFDDSTFREYKRQLNQLVSKNSAWHPPA